MTQPNPMLAGLEGDDLTRAQQADANLAGVVEGRRRAARALVAPPGPYEGLLEDFAPLAKDRNLEPFPDDPNLEGIIAGRRQAATALVAPPEPYTAMVARWVALVRPDNATAPGYWGPTTDATNVFHGDGPPDSVPVNAHPGDVYMDDLTQEVYLLEFTP